MVQIIKVGHYNLMMFYLRRIITVMLWAILCACALSACGQKGPLFLAPQSVPYTLFSTTGGVAPPAAAASSAK
ncbi:MAG: LPS translocon maturation chaperone LptM [Polaromonas sp.]